MMTFKKATKAQARLRLALIGASGSGKTYSALEIARHLGQRVALIDSERGSASKYADLFPFDVLELANFDPRVYIEAIHSAEQAGYDVLIVDSLSHAWMGRGGLLELVDQFTKRSRSGNAFTEGWREASPIHNQLVDALLQCQAHLIVTLRAKQEYVLDPDPKTGRTVPRKVGLAPVQREGLEYEFDVVGTLDQDDHTLVITKTRCRALDGQVIPKPGAELAEVLKAWLSDGIAPEVSAEARSSLGIPLSQKLKLDVRTAEQKHRSRTLPPQQRPAWESGLGSRLEQIVPEAERRASLLKLLFPASQGQLSKCTDAQLLALYEVMGLGKDEATGKSTWPEAAQNYCQQAFAELVPEDTPESKSQVSADTIRTHS